MPRRSAMTPREAFAKLEAAALAGERCPGKEAGFDSATTSSLAHAGKILVEISTHNWRRVTIMVGPHKGKATAPNPLKKSSVYLTIDTRGSWRNGRLVISKAATGNEPSKPQLLPYIGERPARRPRSTASAEKPDIAEMTDAIRKAWRR